MEYALMLGLLIMGIWIALSISSDLGTSITRFGDRITCGEYRPFTPEEIAEEERLFQLASAKLKMALDAVRPLRKQHGGKAAHDAVPCPNRKL